MSGRWRERLSLAGSETSESDPGYLAGAIDAAARAAAEVAGRIYGQVAARAGWSGG